MTHAQRLEEIKRPDRVRDSDDCIKLFAGDLAYLISRAELALPNLWRDDDSG